MSFTVYISVRPGAHEFIEKLSEHFDIIFFTASLKEYADPVMDHLDPKRLAVMRLFREHCIWMDNVLVKDLNIFERELSSVIIIDVYKIQSYRIASSHSNCNLKMPFTSRIIFRIKMIESFMG